MTFRILAAAAATLFLVTACGSGGSDATAAGDAKLTDTECALIAERHRDFTLSQVPAESVEQMRGTADEMKEFIEEGCRSGDIFTRADHACLAATAANSTASHDCIARAD